MVVLQRVEQKAAAERRDHRQKVRAAVELLIRQCAADKQIRAIEAKLQETLHKYFPMMQHTVQCTLSDKFR